MTFEKRLKSGAYGLLLMQRGPMAEKAMEYAAAIMKLTGILREIART